MKIIFPLNLSIILSLTFLVSCKSQVKPLGEAPLQLKSFNFSTKITDILPDKFKSKDYANAYNVPTGVFNVLIEKDTTYDDQYSSERKPIWIEYRKLSSSSGNILALFGKTPFNSVNVVTTLDNKLMMVNGVVNAISKSRSIDFMTSLDRLYGKNVLKKVTTGLGDYDTYTWKLEDRTIKFFIRFDDERNALKIEVDKENKTIKNGEREPHYEGYVYVVDKKYEDKLLDQLHTGDLAFFK